MTDLVACGADPGPSTGLAVAGWKDGRLAFAHAAQCDAGLAPDLLHLLLARFSPRLGGIEAFVSGAHSGRREGTVTRLLVAELSRIATRDEVTLHERAAGHVKPWATDERLRAAGLLALTPGSTHARDACRHLLFAACHDGGLPDPLSRRARQAPSPGELRGRKD